MTALTIFAHQVTLERLGFIEPEALLEETA
jgi:hypothetical protein